MSSHDQRSEAAKNQNRVANPTRHDSLEQLGKEMDEHVKQQAAKPKLPGTYEEMGREMDRYLKQQAIEAEREAERKDKVEEHLATGLVLE
ncbi:hypothetical protein Hte_005863 [Hypoxylon texense]